MIWVLFVLVIICLIVVGSNAATIAQNQSMIAKAQEDIKQLQNESAYLHRQVAVRRNAEGRIQNPGRSIEDLARRAKEARSDGAPTE